MWRLLLVAGLAAGLAQADEHWLRFQSGPFQVFTDAGARAGREMLVRFEEFRYALGEVIGDTGIQTPQPVRILLFRNARESDPFRTPEPIHRGRDLFNIVLTSGQPVPPDVFRDATKLFLETAVARMPAHLERGIIEFLSTIEVNGIRITVGKPPAGRDLDWARVHLLVVDPEYYGRLRVLIFNLRKGVDEPAAYQNAFGKSPADIDRQAKASLAAGSFQTTELSSRPLSVERDFPEKPLAPEDRKLALADLLLGSSRAAYHQMIVDHAYAPEAHEGLGLLALAAGQREEARREFAAGVAANSASAECYVQYAKLEPDASKALPALAQAAKLNPKLPEPHFLMAQRLTDPQKRIAELKAAATLAARNASYWQTLAQAYLDQHDYGDAAKAWRDAEQAASDPAARENFRQARLSIEQQRLDYEAAERRRAEEDKQRDLEKLKAEAQAHVRELEAQANAGSKPSSAPVVPWWDGPKPAGKVSGSLKAVDCFGSQARLVITTDDGRTVRLLVGNASGIAVMGGGDKGLGCGPQKGQRVTVEYVPKTNARRGTSGEVATIEFQ